MAGFFAAFGGWQHVFKVFAYLLAVIPLALVIATALKLFWGVNRLNTRGLAGLLGAGWLRCWPPRPSGPVATPELRRFSRNYPAPEAASGDWRPSAPCSQRAHRLRRSSPVPLRATLVAEHKVRQVMDRWIDHYTYDPFERVDQDEQSNRRILESVKSYQCAAAGADAGLHDPEDHRGGRRICWSGKECSGRGFRRRRLLP